MARFNWSSPSALGAQSQYAKRRTVRLDNPRAFVAMRFAADSASALTSLHLGGLEVIGRDPGLAVEIVDELAPPVSWTVKYPGTDTGATTTGWEDQGDGAANFGEIDDWITTQHLRNSAAVASTKTDFYLKFRGSTTQFTAQQRITDLYVQILTILLNNTGNALGVGVRGMLNISGTDYFAARGEVIRNTGMWETVNAGRFDYDPSTGLGWTRTGINNFLDGATDEFGVKVAGRIAAENYAIGGMRLVPFYCRENRYGSYYSLTTPIDGWVECTLSNTASMAANRFFWVVVSAPSADATNYLTIPVLGDTAANVRTNNGTESGEHRDVVEGVLTSKCGTVEEYRETSDLEVLPILFDISNSIQVSSVPYVETDRVVLENVPGGVYFEGTNSYMTTPDSVPLSITSDISLRCWCAANDWSPGSDQTLVSKWGAAGQRSFYLEVDAASTLTLHWSNDGTADNTLTTATTAVNTLVNDGQGIYLRCDFDVDNGAAGRTATFYYSYDGVTWTSPTGWAQTSATATSIFDSTAAVEVAARTGGTTGFFAGSMYEVEIHSGLTAVDIRGQFRLRPRDVHGDALDDPTGFATKGLDPDTIARNVRLSDTTVAGATGNTFTLGGAAVFARAQVAQEVTTPNPTETIVGVRVPVGWASGLAPDADLVVTLRTGTASAQSGKGTLVDSAYIKPSEVTTRDVRSVDAELVATVAVSTSTQYFVQLSSAASQGRGWLVPVQDTRTDDIDSDGGATTTAAEIQGTSQGGTTDVYIDAAATRLTRYDIPLALVASISGASSVAVTAVAAV